MTGQPAETYSQKLGLPLLSGIVIASMVGSGAFNLPQNMASAAGLAATMLAWIVTFTGMFFLANVFRRLSEQRPDLSAGVYAYARAGFGPLIGFEIAWGYWLATVLGNVALAVLTIKTLGYFIPMLVATKWAMLASISAFLWLMHAISMAGVKRVATLNMIATVINLTVIASAIVVMAFFADSHQFAASIRADASSMGDILMQMRSTMLVTLWVFVGIESAVVISDRAQKASQVGTATFIGLLVCTLIYSLLSVLPFAILPRAALSELEAPSVAYLMGQIVGHWGTLALMSALLLSLVSCLLAWTRLMTELLYESAKDGVFPKALTRSGPSLPLWISSSSMQAAVLVVLFAQNAWIWLISITGVMILPTYLASSAYLCRFAWQRHGTRRRELLITGILACIYSIWMLSAAGLQFLLMSSIFSALGVPIYLWARFEQTGSLRSALTPKERWFCVGLFAMATLALITFILGWVRVD